MRIKYFIPVLFILLNSLLLSACDLGGTSPSLGDITPLDTSAKTLIVTIEITEDQNAVDSKSTLTFQFRTAVVKEDNIVRFTHQEAVTCNSITAKLNDAQVYTLSVPRSSEYACSYTGYTQGHSQLAPVTLLDVAARSTLAPHLQSTSSQGYTISYTPDASSRACSMTAKMIDGENNMFSGPSSPSMRGVYHSPAANSLTGNGTILLERTCAWTLSDPFAERHLSYQSSASIAVTWSH